MAGIRPVFEKGPLSFSTTTAANGGNVKGGQLVMPDGTTGRVRPTTGAVNTCLGVALGDAAASDFANAETTDTWGNPVVNMHFPPNEVAVAYQGVFRLKATTAIAFGELVVSAANGEVNPRGAGTMDLVIGRCVEPAGISAGAKGKILLGGIGA